MVEQTLRMLTSVPVHTAWLALCGILHWSHWAYWVSAALHMLHWWPDLPQSSVSFSCLYSFQYLILFKDNKKTKLWLVKVDFFCLIFCKFMNPFSYGFSCYSFKFQIFNWNQDRENQKISLFCCINLKWPISIVQNLLIFAHCGAKIVSINQHCFYNWFIYLLVYLLIFNSSVWVITLLLKTLGFEVGIG